MNCKGLHAWLATPWPDLEALGGTEQELIGYKVHAEVENFKMWLQIIKDISGPYPRIPILHGQHFEALLSDLAGTLARISACGAVTWALEICKYVK